MQALICRNWGDIDTLELGEMPSPVPGSGQVLLDIVATSANYADAIMVAGNYQTKPELPFAPGLEGAGLVVKLGDGVENLKKSTRFNRSTCLNKLRWINVDEHIKYLYQMQEQAQQQLLELTSRIDKVEMSTEGRTSHNKRNNLCE